jgi:SAM-dependent methyltransferase
MKGVARATLRIAIIQLGLYEVFRRSRRAYNRWQVNRTPNPESRWQSSLTDELNFWEQWVKTRGLEWPDDFARRLNPNHPLQEYVARLLPPANGGDPVRILDVGAGPLTCLGTKWHGGRLEIVPVDPLAEAYNALLTRYNIEPVVTTQQADAEQLVAAFGDGVFDLAHARNALDHCYDPVRAIEEMVRVVRRGGYVVLLHAENEAENEDFHGLHQWSFTVREGELVVRHPRAEYNVSRHLANTARVATSVEDGLVHAEIQRLG